MVNTAAIVNRVENQPRPQYFLDDELQELQNKPYKIHLKNIYKEKINLKLSEILPHIKQEHRNKTTEILYRPFEGQIIIMLQNKDDLIWCYVDNYLNPEIQELYEFINKYLNGYNPLIVNDY